MDKSTFFTSVIPAALALAITAAMPASAQERDSRALPVTAMSDEQILQVVETLNEGEINQAKLALSKSEDAGVKQVAEMILADHEMSEARLEQLEDKHDLDTADSALAAQIERLGETTLDGLKALDGEQFECAYLDEQEKQHKFALETVNDDLMPAAQSEHVKSVLAMSAPKLEHHLDLVQAARGNLDNCG